MAFKMFSTGLMFAFAGMCLCQQTQQQQPQQSVNGPPSTQYQQPQTAVSQASFHTGSAAIQPQIKLEDIERDSLPAAFGQKSAAPQQSGKSSAAPAPAAAPQQQYYVQQPYQAQQPQFYVQPSQQYFAPQYQMAFDYAGVQYMIINPSAYSPLASQYYVPQPSAVPQYVTKSTSATAPISNAASTPTPNAVQQSEYKLQQQFAAPAPQAQQEFKYVMPATAPAYQYVLQPAAAGASSGAVDFSYLTRHPVAPSPQFKAPAVSAQPQYLQYTVPQQQFQQQAQQFYYAPPFTGQVQQSPEQLPRVQVSAKSQFSSGVKSTTPTPFKEPFAYKFEPTPSQQQQQQQHQQQQQQQQQPGATYSTLRFSA